MTGNKFDKKIINISDLIVAHLNGTISEDGRRVLEQWLSEDKENETLLKSLEENVATQKDSEFFSSIDTPTSLEKIKKLTGQTPSQFSRYSKIIKVACLIIVISGVTTLYKSLRKSDNIIAVAPRVQVQMVDTDIKPGGNKAKLELANGSMVVLEDSNAPVIVDNGIRIERQQGVIFYSVAGNISKNGTGYNRISTPKGGKYEIVLPDGTHVWLNSESSLRFPISVSQKERVVELIGEAYFEVAKMANKPFKVHVKDVTVEALGTSFNIMGYENAIKTTLVEGSIKVSKGKLSKMVVPGQQIEVKEALTIQDDTNVLQAIAWKADLFEFENDELQAIFPQLERWYNVKIDCTEEISAKRFTGTISRNTDIMVLLEMLKEAGIAYQLEERRIFLF